MTGCFCFANPSGFSFGPSQKGTICSSVSDNFPTLANVFALSKKIKLNMVEERVVTSGFSRDTTTTSCG